MSTWQQKLVLLAKDKYLSEYSPEYIAPYSPSPLPLITQVITKLSLTSFDVVYDLGCGDGRWLFYIVNNTLCQNVVGIELNITLINDIQHRIEEEGIQNKINIVREDLWKTNIGAATVIILYAFMNLQELKIHLQTSVQQHCKIVSVGVRPFIIILTKEKSPVSLVSNS